MWAHFVQVYPFKKSFSDWLYLFKANPKLASLKDLDERLPIHWAAAYNRLPIVELLVSNKYFDPDITVRLSPFISSALHKHHNLLL